MEILYYIIHVENMSDNHIKELLKKRRLYRPSEWEWSYSLLEYACLKKTPI